MKYVIGCPVRDRAWIIQQWFEHVQLTLDHALVSADDVTFVFVGDQESDDTFDFIHRTEYNVKVVNRLGNAEPYRRNWNPTRYDEMADLRNTLLSAVRKLEPDFFWSLDSDILAAKETLDSALQALEKFDAVGSKCYMTNRGTWAPSYAMLPPSGGLRRVDSEGCFKVDVIMAAKLMSPKAYNVDYVGHRQGEDIGWSIEARKAGCILGWDGRTVSKHVMTPNRLNEVDKRCGF